MDGFDGQGSGPSDCIAYPNIDAVGHTTPREAFTRANIIQLFGGYADSIRNTIDSDMATYAQDAADNGAVISADAAMSVFKIQQDLMVNQGVGLVEVRS